MALVPLVEVNLTPLANPTGDSTFRDRAARTFERTAGLTLRGGSRMLPGLLGRHGREEPVVQEPLDRCDRDGAGEGEAEALRNTLQEPVSLLGLRGPVLFGVERERGRGQAPTRPVGETALSRGGEICLTAP